MAPAEEAKEPSSIHHKLKWRKKEMVKLIIAKANNLNNSDLIEYRMFTLDKNVKFSPEIRLHFSRPHYFYFRFIYTWLKEKVVKFFQKPL